MFETVKLDNNYIVCFPSGEIIYFEDEDIDPLMKRKNIYFDNTLKLYACSDFLSPKVKEFINIKKVPRGMLSRMSIKNFLLDCGLLNDQFEIQDDLSVNAYGPINMAYRKLKKIPIKFNRCTSDFICSHNDLETLENSPRTVHGNFNCSYNNLKNLKGGPRTVSKAYNCSHNELNTLEGAPLRLKHFDCSHNFLKDFDYGPIVSDNYIKIYATSSYD